MSSARIQRLKEFIEPVRNRLINHPIYRSVHSSEEFQTFMEYHVYAVWDFMALLKSLQRSLTCVDIPWVPVGSANTRYLINEIVVGEESDVDQEGQRISHFELYLQAMEEAGASTKVIRALVEAIAGMMPVRAAIEQHVPTAAIQEFLNFTFDTISSGEVHRVASVFTFGREDLIPDLFLPIVQELSKEEPAIFKTFKYYLERHIEVDGDHHSYLAMEMLEELCGEDEMKWNAAAEAARAALEARIVLWDGVVEAIGVGPMIARH